MAATQIIISTAVGYLFVYMLRYPITVLTEIRAQEFGEIFGVNFLVSDSMSIAFLLGFGLAKVPATFVMTSPLYFNHRFAMITFLNLLTGLFIAVPCALSNGDPYWTTLGLFLGCFPSSWVYGGMMAWFEGRVLTDFILGCTTPAYIISGGVSRSAAKNLIAAGYEERWVPFMIFAVVLIPMTLCFLATDYSAKPSKFDISLRKERTSMSKEKMWDFVKDFAFPVSILMLAYATITGVRQFRDLFSDSLFRASNGGEDPSPTFFLLADVGGGLAGFTNLMIMSSAKEAYSSLNLVFGLVIVSLSIALASTGLYTSGLINGLAWQFCVGTGLFGCYSILVAIWDRLVAVSPMVGATCTFLIFTADMSGYVVSIVMVFWKRFAAGEEDTPETVLSQFIWVLTAGSSFTIVAMVLSAVWFRSRRQREEAELALRVGEFD